MDKIYKHIDFQIYDASLFEEYLRQMARKGWMLQTLGYSTFPIMTFKKGEPIDQYFYVDYLNKSHDDFGEELNKYQNFLKQYGYDFVAYRHSLLILSSKQKLSFPIHDNSHEERKIKWKAILKDSLPKILYILMASMWIFYTPFQSYDRGYLDIQGLQTLLSINIIILLIVCFTTLAPPIRYFITKKSTQSLRWMKIRSALQLSYIIACIFNSLILLPIELICILILIVSTIIYRLAH